MALFRLRAASNKLEATRHFGMLGGLFYLARRNDKHSALGMFRLASLRRDSRGGCLYVVLSKELKTIEVVKVGLTNL
jgi:hypothetical protein